MNTVAYTSARNNATMRASALCCLNDSDLQRSHLQRTFELRQAFGRASSRSADAAKSAVNHFR